MEPSLPAVGKKGPRRNLAQRPGGMPPFSSKTWPLWRRLRPSVPPLILCYKVGLSLPSDLGQPLCSPEPFQITVRAGCLQSFLCPHCRLAEADVGPLLLEWMQQQLQINPGPSAQCFKNKDSVPSSLATPTPVTDTRGHHPRKVSVQRFGLPPSRAVALAPTSC